MYNEIVNTFQHCYFTDFKMFKCGIRKCEPEEVVTVNNANYHSFYYVLSGAVTTVGKTPQDIITDQGFLVTPGQSATFAADKADPCHYAFIEFGGIKANDAVAMAGLSFGNPIYTASNLAKQEIMKTALLYIMANPNILMYELIGQFYIFVSALIDSNINRKSINKTSLQDFYVQEIINFIDKNSEKNLQVEDIAAFCKLDRGYVSRMFKNHMNVTLRDFLIQCRMNKACELLKTTNKTLDQISDSLGYSNTFNFSRAFKLFAGTSPTRWRAKNRLV